jgi:hypothetical protein
MAELYTLGKSEVLGAQAYTVDVTGTVCLTYIKVDLWGRKYISHKALTRS